MIWSGLTLLGAFASLAWSILLVRAPGAAMELLILTSPVVVAAWLVLMLTAPAPRRRRRQNTDHAAVSPALAAETRARVLQRDGGRCRLCGAPGAQRITRRRPVRRGDAPEDRFITLCDACAATTALRPAEV